MTTAIAIAITHRNGSRRDRVPQLLQETGHSLRDAGLTACLEDTILWQPQPHPVRLNVIANMRFRWQAEKRWFHRSLVRRLAGLGVTFTRLLLDQLLSPRSAAQGRFLRMILVDKHREAWRRALDAEANVAVVLEDDAVLTKAITDLLPAFSLLDSDQPVFVNLGSGNDRSIYRLRPASVGQGWLEGQFADTAVAYMVNRAGLQAIAQADARWPFARNVGADAMISSAIMHSPGFLCLFPPEPVYLNGTIEGLFTPELPRSRVHKAAKDLI